MPLLLLLQGFGDSVAPARERGLKLWYNQHKASCNTVAPVRERGLKYVEPQGWHAPLCRSREGTWIEIFKAASWESRSACRSREGAWIEIANGSKNGTKKAPRRSRKGAWIEMRPIIASYALALVALARECGLKCLQSEQCSV